ncbi:MAG: tetratricopeptide repeat protein, partial [Acidobacteriota bacterium]
APARAGPRRCADAVGEALALGAPAGELAAADVARHLAFTPEDALAIEEDMLELVRRPPFTESLEAFTHRHAQLQRLRRFTSSTGARRQVESAYAERLARKPDDLPSLRRRAEILERWGESDRALEDRRRLSEARPDLLPWRRAHAIALSRSGDGDAAVRMLEQALGDPTIDDRLKAEVDIDLGGLHEAAGQPGDAAARYRRAAERDPGNPLPPFNLAMLAAQRGQLQRAVDGFEALTRSHPAFYLAWQNLGVAHEKRGHFDAAEAAYRAEMEARPDAPGGPYRLGTLLVARGRVDEAGDAFKEALRRRADHAPSYFRLADIALAGDRAEDAVPLYRLGLRFRPRDVDARRGLERATARLEGAEAPP